MTFVFRVLKDQDIPWECLDRFHDRTIFQTRPWLEFLRAAQGVRPIVIEISRAGSIAGYFTGAIFRRCGVPILGSSFPGWTTGHMGFNLVNPGEAPEIAPAMVAFAFHTLGCWHIEIYDPKVKAEDIRTCFPSTMHRDVSGWVTNLTGTEETILKRMDPDRRRCIKRAAEHGLIVESTQDDSFADDYYSQLVDVFHRQGLVPTYPRARVSLLIRHLIASGHLLLVRVREPEKGRCIGSGIFPAFNDTMYFWGGAAYRADLHCHPNESMHWFAMRYWRARGITRYDMMGGGDYKAKYGGQATIAQWVRVSRFPWLMALRDMAQQVVRLSQVFRGRWGSIRSTPGRN